MQHVKDIISKVSHRRETLPSSPRCHRGNTKTPETPEMTRWDSPTRGLMIGTIAITKAWSMKTTAQYMCF